MCGSLLSRSFANSGTEYRMVLDVLSGVWTYVPADAPSRLNARLTWVWVLGRLLGTMPKKYIAVPERGQKCKFESKCCKDVPVNFRVTEYVVPAGTVVSCHVLSIAWSC